MAMKKPFPLSTKRILLIVPVLLLLWLILAACTGTPEPTPAVTESNPTPSEVEEEPTAEAPRPTDIPTPEPEEVLVVCLGREPETLFLYGGNSAAMWSVLEAIYDGPFDTLDGQPQAVILQNVPSVDNGGVVFEPLAVEAGDMVVNADGAMTALQPGTQILPSGCTNRACAVAWQPDEEIAMDVMQVTYQLLPGLTWSDGAPLTASDSVFSFEMGALESMPLTSTRYDRTSAYTAESDSVAQWTGIPGYFPRDVSSLFAIPQPAHVLGALSAEALLTSPLTNEQPLGWGAYIMEEWVRGDHITLVKNERYFRASEGLPSYDRLVFRFPGTQPQTLLNALLVGECDVVDRTANLESIVRDVRLAEIDGQLKLHLSQGPDWTQLVFGIKPASYDDGYNVFSDDRPDIFSDPLVRKAVAACIDREEIIRRFYANMVSVPESYLLPTRTEFLAGQEITEFDPQQAQEWLQAAGWVDAGGETRVASGVEGVFNDTPLTIDLAMVRGADWERSEFIIGLVSEGLQACGIGVIPLLATPTELYAPGPDGRIFGRQFDLAQITWMAGNEPACSLYLSEQIPNRRNFWIGANVGGYENEAYDEACQLARSARLDAMDVYLEAHHNAQRLFLAEMPAVPLFFNLHAAAAQPDVCGFAMNDSVRSDLWNLESWHSGGNCTD
jgi:peptide/nickel transport system substrate-binding protein